MPTYEYRCKDCDHSFEVVQAFSDDALTECPTCGGKLKKVFGNVGITFKGGGFYKTDSRKAESGRSQKSSDSSSGGAASDSKAEKKPSEAKSSSDGKSSSAPATATTS